MKVTYRLCPKTPEPNCIKQFWRLTELNRHLTGIFWPTRFDVTIETIARISLLEVGYPINFFIQFRADCLLFMTSFN